MLSDNDLSYYVEFTEQLGTYEADVIIGGSAVRVGNCLRKDDQVHVHHAQIEWR